MSLSRRNLLTLTAGAGVASLLPAAPSTPSTDALDISPSVYDGFGIQFVQKSSGVAGSYQPGGG